jgi:hypothetical protein
MKVGRKVAVATSVAALAALPAVALASSGHGHSGSAPGLAISQQHKHQGSSTSASDKSTAEKQCRSQLQSMGRDTFDMTYGTNKNKRNAFGKCVSKMESQDAADQSSAHNSAEQQCRSQLQSMGTDAFDNQYGTNKNKRNAFGKCVSGMEKALASSMERKQVRALDAAAKTCRSAKSSDPTMFATTYGTGRNAFGKCVSQTAKSEGQQTTGS